MRFLHTGDWHLGRTMRGKSRFDECERVLAEVSDIARREKVDVMLVAGDVFDTFSPPPEYEKLLYETLGGLLRDGIKVVMIAGNHDHAPRMDALSGVLKLLDIHAIGAVRDTPEASLITIASRDGSATAAVSALPWVPERRAVEFETLFKGPDAARTEYRKRLEEIVVPKWSSVFPRDTVNVLVGHMLIDGVTIGEGSGERKLHIGHNFAVNASCFTDAAQYVALGHVHKRQHISAATPVWYAGSLLQLDFGEGGQEKFVNVVDIKPGLPAEVNSVPITGGRTLRTLRITLDELPAHEGKYPDDYLRVIMLLDRPMSGVYERVLGVLPNAVDVSVERTDEPQEAVRIERAGLSPRELFARFYAQKHSAEIPDDVAQLFDELFAEETSVAPA